MTRHMHRNGWDRVDQLHADLGEPQSAWRQVLELLVEQGFEGLAAAMQTLLNEAMKLEREQALGAASYVRTPDRMGHANGFKDRTLRTVFTHDHFGPSTHQQAGLYAGLVVEPPKSLWYENEKTSPAPFGGTDPATGRPLPGRTVTGAHGTRVADGGPTTWQAVIETPDLPGQSTRRDSFREFVFALQDTVLTYAPFPTSAVSSFATTGTCSDTGKSLPARWSGSFCILAGLVRLECSTVPPRRSMVRVFSRFRAMT